MLPKKYRLDKKEFNKIFKEGKSFNSQFFVAKTMKNAGGVSKFSISAPTKTEKKALKRNQLRRRGYSIIEKLKGKTKSGYSTVIILKKESKKLNFEEYKNELESLLKDIGIFK